MIHLELGMIMNFIQTGFSQIIPNTQIGTMPGMECLEILPIAI